METTGTQSNTKAVFYFKCPTLDATINNVTCERSRTEKPKTDAPNSVRKCRKCSDFEQHQAVDPIPADVYHAAVVSEFREKPAGSGYRQHWRHIGKN